MKNANRCSGKPASPASSAMPRWTYQWTPRQSGTNRQWDELSSSGTFQSWRAQQGPSRGGEVNNQHQYGGPSTTNLPEKLESPLRARWRRSPGDPQVYAALSATPTHLKSDVFQMQQNINSLKLKSDRYNNIKQCPASIYKILSIGCCSVESYLS